MALMYYAYKHLCRFCSSTEDGPQEQEEQNTPNYGNNFRQSGAGTNGQTGAKGTGEQHYFPPLQGAGRGTTPRSRWGL